MALQRAMQGTLNQKEQPVQGKRTMQFPGRTPWRNLQKQKSTEPESEASI